MSDNEERAAHQLQDVQQWAKEKIATGNEPPWAWFQYMKLVETTEAILSGMGCSITKESSPQSAQHQGVPLRLVDSTYQQDSVQSHPSGVSVQMPM